MEWPIQHYVKYAKEFYIVQFGNHLYTFIDHLINKFHDPKYYEYILHHALAIFLLFFSYMSHFMLFGLVVLFLHDPGDVWLISARGYTDYRFKKTFILISIYAICYIVWIYTRNYMFPKCCIGSGI